MTSNIPSRWCKRQKGRKEWLDSARGGVFASPTNINLLL